jgi:hypothetical protein
MRKTIKATMIDIADIEYQFRKRFVKTVKAQSWSRNKQSWRVYEYERLSADPEELLQWIVQLVLFAEQTGRQTTGILRG